MKSEYIFLALVVPGPKHPGKKLNILMQPLVDELLKLWEGVETYDASVKRHFKMRAAYMWSVHDFPAYGDFTGWSTHGRFSCPICLCDSKAFTLRYGRKACWFDCHRHFLPEDHEFKYQANAFRKNTVVLDDPPRQLTGEEIFAQINKFVGDTKNYGILHNWTHVCGLWQLPCFHKLLLPHNIDVMHNERNVAEATWNSCLDIADKTKDNAKARQDLAQICNHPSQHLKLKANGKWDKPRAPFCIDKNDKPKILMWFQELKFPDGYAANIRRGVNLLQKKIFGLKSHDYHIFMERLLPVAFRGFLPENIWLCLVQLSFFYRQLCAQELSKDNIKSLEQQIVVLVCKLEKIFPPGFFNPMQHLIIHLPREARLGGPVQSRWSYPFERQFAYANYHPKEYKYGSQFGVILKRLYPGGIDVRDEEGNVVGQRPALLWFDYFCKMDERGVTNARLVKQEFWSVFSVTRQNIRKANRNLESYLAKRVSDMMYQARLDAVKDHEGCDDDKPRNILLTEEQYLNCRLDWCPMDARALLAKYWVSKEFLERRLALQAARAKSNEDMAQNRGGSRPWSETQQLLEYKYGPERAGTLNTYAVMKSGFKNVDSTGRSAPIRNVKAKKRLDDYTARAQPAENSKELDGRVLYSMENGMRHGRLPIADGAVGKENVMALAKSNRFHSTNTAAYLSAIKENEQLKEAFQQLKQSNAQLKETNDILLEENSVGRDLSMRLYEQLNKQAPPDLLARLAGLEAHRNKVNCSSNVGSCIDGMHNNQDDMHTDSDDGNYQIGDEESYDDIDDEESCDEMESSDDMVDSDNAGSEGLDNN